MNNWNNVFARMSKGEIPFSRKFYCVDVIQEGGTIDNETVTISPTQQNVQQARSELKRRIKEAANKRGVKKRKTTCSNKPKIAIIKVNRKKPSAKRKEYPPQKKLIMKIQKKKKPVKKYK